MTHAPGAAGSGSVAGVDFGRTWLRFGVADPGGPILAQERVPTQPDRGPDAVISAIADGLRRVCRSAGRSPAALRAVAVGAPGPLDPDRGVLLSPANLPGWDTLPLADRLAAQLGAPCRVEHDANLAALAEFREGAGVGTTNFVYVTVSTGVGAGLIVEGRLYRGAHGTAGELGHVVVDPDGPPCDCGNRGCLEMFASGPAIAGRAAAELAARPVDGPAGPLGRRAARSSLDGAAVAAAAAEGDATAAGVLAAAAVTLGIALGGLVNLLGPDAVALGGGVTQAGPPFWDGVRRGLAAGSIPAILARCRVGPARLGQDQGLVGALAWASLAATGT